MTSEYGTYRLSYIPPEAKDYQDYPLISIDMCTPGDANVDQMLKFFEAFLSAAGYMLKGELQVAEPETFVPFSLADDVISFSDK